MTGDSTSASDPQHDAAMAEFEQRLTELANRFADRIDTSWPRYRAACMQLVTLSKRTYDRHWFALLDRTPRAR